MSRRLPTQAMGDDSARLPQTGAPSSAGSDRPYEHEKVEGAERADEAALQRVLAETSELAAGWGRPYAFMGGVASEVLGRSRWIHDIDLFVRAHDARDLLQVLAAAGFDTEERDQRWLYKAHRHGIMVDVIFRIVRPMMSRAITLDDQMYAHVRSGELRGVRLPLISPEDLLVIKALAHQEFRSRHWFDGLGLIAAGALDWDYLVQRAVWHGPRRVLSLLLYAQSDGLHVPERVIGTLYDQVHTQENGTSRRPEAPDAPDVYLIGRITDRLARDPRTAELEVEVELDNEVVVLTGSVATRERRSALTEVAAAAVPGHPVRNMVTVAGPPPEPAAEHVEQV